MQQRDIVIYEKVLEYISLEISQVLKKVPTEFKANIEEIRLRNGLPLNIYSMNEDYL